MNPEIDELLERRLREARALGDASSGLANLRPDLSARTGLTAGQRSGGWSLLGALVVFAIMVPGALGLVAVGVASGLFAALIAMRLASAMAAALRKPRPIPEPLAPEVPDDDNLPVITYLVALYKEENVAAALVEAIAAIDYPADRRDVKLLVESDDERTLAALRLAPLPQGFEILPVPPGHPRTKPRALNYGLYHSRGDIIAVLDAEDRPSPGQAREAAAALFSGGETLAVVQAPLLAHNGAQTWIARQFDVEYAIHFLVWLPFLASLGVPLSLGGTSNYFRRDCLEAAGGWDAWNVTEDADLGFRLARRGWRAATITSPTFEEAPVRLRHWRAQRTRWMKGHMQTWLVLMRDPLTTIREMGPARFFGVQVTLGGSLLASALHGPIMLFLVASALAGDPVAGWSAGLLGAGYASVVLAALATGRKPSWIALLTLPFYWPLHSLAMVRALWELKIRPHHWAKTPHGFAPQTVATAGAMASAEAAKPVSLHAAAEAKARGRYARRTPSTHGVRTSHQP